MTGYHILLVEDDPNDVFFFERAMNKASINLPLQVARDGREAIDYLSGDAPLCLLVVLDLNLPQMTGLQVLQWIRESAPQKKVPVIILTSSTSQRDKQQAELLGANIYLNKPSDPSVLVDLLRGLKRDWLDRCQTSGLVETIPSN